MPYDSSIIGTTVGPLEFQVDPGWTMGYAAGIDDPHPRYIDSLKSGQLIAHPVFPVCLVWHGMTELDRRLKDSPLKPEERVRRVHATQDMLLRRPIRPPENLKIRSTALVAEQRRPGTYMVMRHEIVDAADAPVATIHWGVIYRTVELVGGDRRADATPQPPAPPKWDGHPRAEFLIPISATAGILFAAGGRQNPFLNIHTDTASARRAGLPGPILAGAEMLAISVSRIIAAEAGGDPERVARACARFGAMVMMPSEVNLRVLTRAKTESGEAVFFEVINAEGGRAIRDGVVVLRA
jgi:acyl dehydratase